METPESREYRSHESTCRITLTECCRAVPAGLVAVPVTVRVYVVVLTNSGAVFTRFPQAVADIASRIPDAADRIAVLAGRLRCGVGLLRSLLRERSVNPIAGSRSAARS